MMDLNLSGKRAVVTGASLGIGEAVVKELADMGAEVVSVPGTRKRWISSQPIRVWSPG